MPQSWKTRVREDGKWRIARRKVEWDLLAGATPPAKPASD
jgi:hypothetical protein